MIESGLDGVNSKTLSMGNIFYVVQFILLHMTLMCNGQPWPSSGLLTCTRIDHFYPVHYIANLSTLLGLLCPNIHLECSV